MVGGGAEVDQNKMMYGWIDEWLRIIFEKLYSISSYIVHV